MKLPEIEIYTDGSCHTQKRVGAWAALIFIEGKKTILQGVEEDTTHNRMELLAVIKAIKWADENGFNKAVFTIFSDSQYVINLDTRKEKLVAKEFITKKGTAIQNIDLVQQILNYYNTHNIHLHKVKAHQKPDGTENFNREVDMIVRKLVRKNVN
ncbi:MAG: ribonuclease HI [Bacteroidetes bacterium]|nr:ribonuclease HI [Bacteroidota bacterium]